MRPSSQIEGSYRHQTKAYIGTTIIQPAASVVTFYDSTSRRYMRFMVELLAFSGSQFL